MTPGRAEAELGVEGRDAEDVALGELEPARDAAHGVGRQVAEGFLGALQHGHEVGGAALELAHDGRPGVGRRRSAGGGQSWRARRGHGSPLPQPSPKVTNGRKAIS